MTAGTRRGGRRKGKPAKSTGRDCGVHLWGTVQQRERKPVEKPPEEEGDDSLGRLPSSTGAAAQLIFASRASAHKLTIPELRLRIQKQKTTSLINRVRPLPKRLEKTKPNLKAPLLGEGDTEEQEKPNPVQGLRVPPWTFTFKATGFIKSSWGRGPGLISQRGRGAKVCLSQRPGCRHSHVR